jgi:hypothetical protein
MSGGRDHLWRGGTSTCSAGEHRRWVSPGGLARRRDSLTLGGVVAWGADVQAGPSRTDLCLEGRYICERRLLGQARRRLSGVVKLAGKVGSMNGGVAARPLVVDLVPWRSSRRSVGLGQRELSYGLPHGLHGQRKGGEEVRAAILGEDGECCRMCGRRSWWHVVLLWTLL